MTQTKMILDIDIHKCIYCAETIKDEKEKHFISDCCGRGMCDTCYDNLRGTDEQIQMNFFETESEDEEIIQKCGWENTEYICYYCFENWAYYVKNETKCNECNDTAIIETIDNQNLCSACDSKRLEKLEYINNKCGFCELSITGGNINERCHCD